SKIYSDHPQAAQVEGILRVDAGACLEWLPQEAIVFEGAQYHQTWRVELAPGAHWLGWDIVRLGRTARSEKFRRGELRSHCEVWHDGTLIWLDPQRLIGHETLWQSHYALGTCPVLATLAWVGTLPEAALIAMAREAWEAMPNPTGEAGVTRLQLGMLCRYRGHSTREARHWFTSVWNHLRSYYAGRSICLPRVWQR
ncbi:MAG: urease accessory protein UreD, partial [Leptolyngbya sp. SIO1D8]|nr:urease accessory protein UreD [Leptolyngbya sp. SIO1D8]